MELLIENVAIRIGEHSDAEFLLANTYAPSPTILRKIESKEFIVATLPDGKPIGFIQLEYLWSMVPYIALIRVVVEHRLSGVGKKLLRFAEELLRKDGHRTLYTSSQEDEPEPQDWHRHMGFVECGSIAGINDGVGEIFFCKKLYEE